MGIVVAVSQALGLLAYWFNGPNAANRSVRLSAIAGLVLLGLWNTLWYGLRHLEQFWGQAAIITGLIMLMAALDLSGRRLSVPRPVIVAALFASFALYAVTLVRLNLGLNIIV